MDPINRDKIADIFLIIAALLMRFYVIPHHITITEESAIVSLSPAFFPKLAVWLIAGLATLHLLLTFKRGTRPATEEDVEAWLTPKEEYKAYVSSLLIIAYLFTMKYVGFILTTIVVLGVLFVMQGVKGPVKAMIISVMVTIGVYLLFFYTLKIHFPMGMLFE